MDEILIDGSMGEGGGQILRASLALSMALGRPFRIENIRAHRPSPGLKRQHLTCVRAARELCGAEVSGDEMGSRELSFVPGPLRPGEYHFAIGSGGSITLVLQALLPPLLTAAAPSRITVTGGTHVPHSPPFEFMALTLLPRLEALGPHIKAKMERSGYMQIGGGSVTVDIDPVPKLDVPEGFAESDASVPFHGTEALIYAHNLPDDVAAREQETLMQPGFAALGLTKGNIRILNQRNNPAPEGQGNAVLLILRHGQFYTVFGETGWRGRTAETVAGHAANRALLFLKRNVCMERHLADQLIVPLALAGGGSLITETPTPHCRTCLEVAARFTGLRAGITPIEGKRSRIGLN